MLCLLDTTQGRCVHVFARVCAPTVHACVSAVMGYSVSLHAHISWCLQRLICVDIQASFTRCLVSFCWSRVRPHKHVHAHPNKHSLDSPSWFPHLLLTFFSHLYLYPQQGICKMCTVLCLVSILSHQFNSNVFIISTILHAIIPTL